MPTRVDCFCATIVIIFMRDLRIWKNWAVSWGFTVTLLLHDIVPVGVRHVFYPQFHIGISFGVYCVSS